ncbi:unnamed protein product [Lathyrus sativus]|nr:unnamed protein product [Lathyrus sativus]
MGLNSRDIKLHLLKVFHLSIEKSYTFMKKYPKISGAMLVFLIMYIFLSCIYNLLVFFSPFIVFTAILITIFWSSEQPLLKCVEKKESEKIVEAKNPPNVYMKDRRGMLYKYPSQNATSRRRNFTGKKLDVYGDLEQKAKNLSAVFRNEFTKKNTEIRSGVRFLDKEMDPYFDSKSTSRKVDDPLKQTLHATKPSMDDLVTCNASYYDCQEMNTEKTEEEKKAIEDSSSGNNKGAEHKEEDQKKLMDLGICEMERNKRLESLIARRRARKQLNLEIENGLLDMESISPSQISPLLIARMDPFDSPRYFEGIEMPGSAPSALRSPFDIPYEPFEEKPNLKGDILDHELTSDMHLEPKHDLLQVREHRQPGSRVRRVSGLSNHEGPEKLNSSEGSESKLQAPNLSNEGDETTHEGKGKCKIDMVSEEVDDNDPTLTNIEGVIASAPNPQDEFLDFPLSTTNVTNINDSLYESLSTPVFKSDENMLVTNGLIRHKQSLSLASDLQVEFSEIGSPTLTVDEGHEDMWGANESSDHDNLEPNNWRDVGSSSYSLQNIDEENDGELSFMSPRSDTRDDTPTYISRRDHNLFGNARKISVPRYSSDVLARWKRLMWLMDTRVNQSPHKMLPDKVEVCNQTDNLTNKEQISSEVNDSEATEQDNTNDLRSNEEPGASVTQKEAPNDLINKEQISNDENDSEANEHDNTNDVMSNEKPGASVTQQETPNDIINKEQISNDENDSEATEQDNTDDLRSNEEPGASVTQQEAPNDLINKEQISNDENDSEANEHDNTNDLMSNEKPGASVTRQEAPNDLINKEQISNDENDSEADEHDNTNDLRSNEKPGASVTQQEAPNDLINKEQISNDENDSEADEHDKTNDLMSNEKPGASVMRQEAPNDLTHKEQISNDVNDSEATEQDSINELRSNEEPGASVTRQEAPDDLTHKEQISNDVNDSEATEQDSINELRSNEEPGASVTRQEAPDEISIITTSPSSSLTSVLQIPHTTVADQEIHTGIQPSYIEDVTQETVNGEGLLDSMSQNIQLFVDDSNVESHNRDLDNSQEQLISPMVESSSEIHIENEGKSQASLTEEASMKPFINFETVNTNSAEDFEDKQDSLKENEAENHSSNEDNYLQSESNQVVNDHIDKEQLDKGNDISDDSSLPMVTEETINADDTLRESSMMNNNEANDRELDENNETVVSSEPAGETDKVSNIAHMNDP